jgi:DNA-binding transcriptional regulator YiaG
VTFADKLKSWRAANHHTQESSAEFLSRAAGVKISLYTVRAWEQGRGVPHPLAKSVIERIINAA